MHALLLDRHFRRLSRVVDIDHAQWTRSVTLTGLGRTIQVLAGIQQTRCPSSYGMRWRNHDARLNGRSLRKLPVTVRSSYSGRRCSRHLAMMAAMTVEHRFYGELAEWWPLLSPYTEYAEEAA